MIKAPAKKRSANLPIQLPIERLHEGEAAIPQPGEAPPFEPEREIRFAIVMYGGISLAIYMNGIAHEMLELVKATAPDKPALGQYPHNGETVLPKNALFPDTALKGTAAVYRKLARILADGSATAYDPQQAIKVRFVVDIVSGTSAGGLNGLFLAKALVRETSLDALAKLWVEEGDIGKLLNDGKSFADLVGLFPSGPPESLLNSTRMYAKLLRAFYEMEQSPLLPSSPATQAQNPGGPALKNGNSRASSTNWTYSLPRRTWPVSISPSFLQTLLTFRIFPKVRRTPRGKQLRSENTKRAITSRIARRALKRRTTTRVTSSRLTISSLTLIPFSHSLRDVLLLSFPRSPRCD